MAGDIVGEAKDPAGVRVVVPEKLWREKILRGHPSWFLISMTSCEPLLS